MSASGPARDGLATGHLLSNALLFARLLRVGDLDVTPRQIADWIEAMRHIDVRRRQVFRDAARALLVSRRDDLEWFDAAFDLFWQARNAGELEGMDLGRLVQRTRRRVERSALGGGEVDTAVAGDETVAIPAWSDLERLRNTDFAELDGAELEQVRRLIDRLRWPLAVRRTRRWRRRSRGRGVDLRSTLRRSLSRGGEPLELVRRSRRLGPRPLVVLSDVSGSMEPYSRLLLRFLYAVTRSRATTSARVETFAFGTRLTRLTGDLRRRRVDEALQRAADRVEDWGSGTRTGASLATFNRIWAPRVLARGASVLIISDGWDRGDLDQLDREMARLRRRCRRLIWLNPLLGSPSYRPLTGGMKTCLPYVDDFLPVHDLRSLEQLGDLLADVGSDSGTAGAAGTVPERSEWAS